MHYTSFSVEDVIQYNVDVMHNIDFPSKNYFETNLKQYVGMYIPALVGCGQK